MAGPWEKYQQPAAASAPGPWMAYQQQPSSNFATVEETPGMGGAAPTAKQPQQDQWRSIGQKIGDVLKGGASLADVTIGGIIPGAVQQVAYPVARAIGKSPAQAEAFSNQLVGAVDKPFGKAFGITQDPAYQQEASRQVLEFVGQNYGKGADWIAKQTGLPAQDVANMMATLTPVAAKAVKPVVQAGANALAPAVEYGVNRIAESKPVVAATQALAERGAAKAQARSLKSWEQTPQIEAADAARKLGVAINPAQSAPSVKNKMLVGAIGESSVEDALAKSNRPVWNKVARDELNLPAGTPLDRTSFNKYRDQNSGSYRQIENMGVLSADDSVKDGLSGLKLNPASTNDPVKVEKVNAVVDRVAQQMENGLNGSNVIGQIRGFRNDANKTFRRPDASPVDIEVAKVQLGIANQLEDLISSNLKDNPTLLDQFKKDRTALAKSYDWERATDPITKQVDPLQLAKDIRNGLTLSGKLADVAKVAGTFPEIAATSAPTSPQVYQMLRRGGFGGTVGFALGGGPVGAALGAGITSAGGRLAERWLATPQAQNMLAVPKDYRLPLNQNALIRP